jgi:hypothetical protein
MCCCLEPHEGDSQAVTGFKRLKKMTPPELEEWLGAHPPPVRQPGGAYAAQGSLPLPRPPS